MAASESVEEFLRHTAQRRQAQRENTNDDEAAIREKNAALIDHICSYDTIARTARTLFTKEWYAQELLAHHIHDAAWFSLRQIITRFFITHSTKAHLQFAADVSRTTADQLDATSPEFYLWISILIPLFAALDPTFVARLVALAGVLKKPHYPVIDQTRTTNPVTSTAITSSVSENRAWSYNAIRSLAEDEALSPYNVQLLYKYLLHEHYYSPDRNTPAVFLPGNPIPPTIVGRISTYLAQGHVLLDTSRIDDATCFWPAFTEPGPFWQFLYTHSTITRAIFNGSVRNVAFEAANTSVAAFVHFFVCFNKTPFSQILFTIATSRRSGDNIATRAPTHSPLIYPGFDPIIFKHFGAAFTKDTFHDHNDIPRTAIALAFDRAQEFTRTGQQYDGHREFAQWEQEDGGKLGETPSIHAGRAKRKPTPELEPGPLVQPNDPLFPVDAMPMDSLENMRDALPADESFDLPPMSGPVFATRPMSVPVRQAAVPQPVYYIHSDESSNPASEASIINVDEDPITFPSVKQAALDRAKIAAFRDQVERDKAARAALAKEQRTAVAPNTAKEMMRVARIERNTAQARVMLEKSHHLAEAGRAERAARSLASHQLDTESRRRDDTLTMGFPEDDAFDQFQQHFTAGIPLNYHTDHPIDRGNPMAPPTSWIWGGQTYVRRQSSNLTLSERDEDDRRLPAAPGRIFTYRESNAPAPTGLGMVSVFAVVDENYNSARQAFNRQAAQSPEDSRLRTLYAREMAAVDPSRRIKYDPWRINRTLPQSSDNGQPILFDDDDDDDIQSTPSIFAAAPAVLSTVEERMIHTRVAAAREAEILARNHAQELAALAADGAAAMDDNGAGDNAAAMDDDSDLPENELDAVGPLISDRSDFTDGIPKDYHKTHNIGSEWTACEGTYVRSNGDDDGIVDRTFEYNEDDKHRVFTYRVSRSKRGHKMGLDGDAVYELVNERYRTADEEIEHASNRFLAENEDEDVDFETWLEEENTAKEEGLQSIAIQRLQAEDALKARKAAHLKEDAIRREKDVADNKRHREREAKRLASADKAANERAVQDQPPVQAPRAVAAPLTVDELLAIQTHMLAGVAKYTAPTTQMTNYFYAISYGGAYEKESEAPLFRFLIAAFPEDALTLAVYIAAGGNGRARDKMYGPSFATALKLGKIRSAILSPGPGRQTQFPWFVCKTIANRHASLYQALEIALDSQGGSEILAWQTAHRAIAASALSVYVDLRISAGTQAQAAAAPPEAARAPHAAPAPKRPIGSPAYNAGVAARYAERQANPDANAVRLAHNRERDKANRERKKQRGAGERKAFDTLSPKEYYDEYIRLNPRLNEDEKRWDRQLIYLHGSGRKPAL